MAVAQQTLQPIRLCVQDTQSPVWNMCLKAVGSMHTYGVLPTAVLSKTYSGACQLKYEPT